MYSVYAHVIKNTDLVKRKHEAASNSQFIKGFELPPAEYTVKTTPTLRGCS